MKSNLPDPGKITLKWLLHNLPLASLYAGGAAIIAALVSFFFLGSYLGNYKLLKEVDELKLENEYQKRAFETKLKQIEIKKKYDDLKQKIPNSWEEINRLQNQSHK